MKLDAYLAKTSVSYEKFAQRIGAANASVVHKYATGKRVPRPRFMAAIVRETAGAVQPNDFLEIAAAPPAQGE